MKFAVFALLAASVSAKGKNLKFVDPSAPCRKSSGKPQPGLIKKPLEPVESLPDQWLWNDIEGVNYLTNLRN